MVDKANYELVYSAALTPGTSLEDIYTRFNIDHPKDFKGHSLSVSDVVVLHQNGQDTAHYVDSFGYKQVPEFLQEQKQLTPDELETGETIKTPRGTFYVTDMSREQMEAAGYGFHHQSDDGKYLIMGNGTRAFAIAAEQPENHLKAAEQTTEQNENMIDGIINNTPTVDELEAKVKAGETISLVDLANAVKADKERGKEKPEKKPSIRAQLRADKENSKIKKSRIGGMSMNRLTVEETNLLSIYRTGSRQGLIVAMRAALPFMDGDMRDFAARTLSKVEAMTEAEFVECGIYAADEV